MKKLLKTIAEVVAFALSVIAILFAAIQFTDSRELKVRIKDLLDEASTKYIGLFPDNLDDINRMVPSARYELRILSDYPGYGHYSQPKRYARYSGSIIELRQRKPPPVVRMLFYSAAIRNLSARDQFKRGDWEQIKKTDTFKEFFGTFHPGVKEPKTYEEFVESLTGIQGEYEKALCYNGVQIVHINNPLVLFFWLADEDRAVFSINSRDEKERELSFQSSEGKLTHAFKSIFDRLWMENKDDPNRCNVQTNGGATSALPP